MLQCRQFGHGAQQWVEARSAIVPGQVAGLGDQQVVGLGNGIGHHALQGKDHAPVKAPHLRVARRFLIVHKDVAVAQAPDAKVKGLLVEDGHHQVFEHDRLSRGEGDRVRGQDAEVDLDEIVTGKGAGPVAVVGADPVFGRLLGHDLEAGDVVSDPADLGITRGLGLVLYGQPHPEMGADAFDLAGHVEDGLAHDVVDVDGGPGLVLAAHGVDGAGHYRLLGAGETTQLQGEVVPERIGVGHG